MQRLVGAEIFRATFSTEKVEMFPMTFRHLVSVTVSETGSHGPCLAILQESICLGILLFPTHLKLVCALK